MIMRSPGKKSNGYQNGVVSGVASDGMAHSRPDPPKMSRNLKLDVIVNDMADFSFVCLLKLILYNSKPQNQMCD